MDCKVGDIVHVRKTVVEFTGRLWFKSSDGTTCHEPMDDIVHIEPRPLAVGDKVTWGSGVMDFRIVHIHNGKVMLDGHDSVHDLAKLRRVS